MFTPTKIPQHLLWKFQLNHKGSYLMVASFLMVQNS